MSVSEPFSHGLYERNERICTAVNSGEKRKDVAKRHGLTKARIYQIIHRQRWRKLRMLKRGIKKVVWI